MTVGQAINFLLDALEQKKITENSQLTVFIQEGETFFNRTDGFETPIPIECLDIVNTDRVDINI